MGNMWSAIPVALLCMVVNRNERKQGSGPKGESPVEHRGTLVRPSFHQSPPGPLRPEICPLRPETYPLRP